MGNVATTLLKSALVWRSPGVYKPLAPKTGCLSQLTPQSNTNPNLNPNTNPNFNPNPIPNPNPNPNPKPNLPPAPQLLM